MSSAIVTSEIYCYDGSGISFVDHKALFKRQSLAYDFSPHFPTSIESLLAESSNAVPQVGTLFASLADFVVPKSGAKPLLGKNPTLGKNKNRVNTELEGGTATAKSIFRNQTKGQKVTQQPLGPKGGVRRVAEDGTQIRLPTTEVVLGLICLGEVLAALKPSTLTADGK